MTNEEMLQIAIDEAKIGLSEGGIPIGAALFSETGALLGRGHNRRVQDDDPSAHAETDAFRKAGRQRFYHDKIMVTTLSPCWYCSGLIRQFGIGRVVVGDSETFTGGLEWLRENGVEILDMKAKACSEVIQQFILSNRELWFEDIGK